MAPRTEMKATTRVVTGPVLLSLLLAGCGQAETGNSRDIDAASFEDETGADWPLSVTSGRLLCDPESQSVYFYDPATTNSYIIGEGRLELFTKKITPIRVTGTDLDPLEDLGRTLC